MSDIVWRGSRSGNAYLAHAFKGVPSPWGTHKPLCGRAIDRPDTACRHELCQRCLDRAGEPAGWADHTERIVEALRWVADTLPACGATVVLHGPRGSLDVPAFAHVDDRPVSFERYADNRFAWEVHATYDPGEPQPGWAKGPRTAASIAWCPSCGYHRDKGQPDTMAGAIASAEARVIRHVEEALWSFGWARGPWLDAWQESRLDAWHEKRRSG